MDPRLREDDAKKGTQLSSRALSFRTGFAYQVNFSEYLPTPPAW
jgi:hypothetical protein